MFKMYFGGFFSRAQAKNQDETKPLLGNKMREEDKYLFNHIKLLVEIETDRARFLSQNYVSKRIHLSEHKIKKTESELRCDFERKNEIFLQKKREFNARRNDGSSVYQGLRQAYLESAEAAYAAINHWGECLRDKLEALGPEEASHRWSKR